MPPPARYSSSTLYRLLSRFDCERLRMTDERAIAVPGMLPSAVLRGASSYCRGAWGVSPRQDSSTTQCPARHRGDDMPRRGASTVPAPSYRFKRNCPPYVADRSEKLWQVRGSAV